MPGQTGKVQMPEQPVNEKVLILGGTREAAELADQLVRKGHAVTSSLAGRTKEPKPVAGTIRIGGFGGPEGLAGYLAENNFNRLIDATHPFAVNISVNAKIASQTSGIPLEIHKRIPWEKQPGDLWLEVQTLEQARDVIPQNARVLLALGSQHIDLFKSRQDVFFLVRMVDTPAEPLPLPNHELLIGKPSSSWCEEKQLLEHHAITHIVCRNSGGKGAYAKITAARKAALEVIIVKMPETIK